LKVDLSRKNEVVPAFRYWWLRKFKELLDLFFFLLACLDTPFTEIALSVLHCLRFQVLELFVSVDLDLGLVLRLSKCILVSESIEF
jgi:hypothetical protein